MYKIAIAAVAALLISGCSFAPDLQVPEVQQPASFNQESTEATKNYWKRFGDSKLDGYVKQLLEGNYDLRESILQIRQARASLKIANADLYPTLSGSAEARKYTTSNEAYREGSRVRYENFGLSAVLDYEIDLWGRVENNTKAAESSLLSAQYTKEALEISLIATLAESYFNVISLKNRVAIAKETLQIRTDEVAYREKQYNAGVIDALVLNQAEIEAQSAKMVLLGFEANLKIAKSNFKNLLGVNPQAYFDDGLTFGEELPNVENPPINLASSLLERRADVQAALERLKATNALVGVAKAAYFPTISLSGVLGLASEDLGSLASSSASLWNFGGGVAAPILDFGRRDANVESAKNSKEIAALGYERTLKQAYKEVYDALTQLSSSKEQLENSEKQVAFLEKSEALVKKRYESGYSSYLEMLDIERALFSARLEMVAYKQAKIAAYITLYKSLGGGWSAE